MNEPQVSAQTDTEWLALTNRMCGWFQGPLSSLILAGERRLLCDGLTHYSDGCLVHYGPHAELPPSTGQIQHGMRLRPPLPGVDIAHEEGAWLLNEHAADVVLLQHGLDFRLPPHRLLYEAVYTVHPGSHLLLTGINPWSLCGIRHYLTGNTLRQARYTPPSRTRNWLNLLGFALKKQCFECYRPPLASVA